ncbi:MAG TPA: hypothetical protein VM600_08600, partial [Actinomycetota bacterium]|nr:hypothetical protein [Actinomycetota bacterium]
MRECPGVCALDGHDGYALVEIQIQADPVACGFNCLPSMRRTLLDLNSDTRSINGQHLTLPFTFTDPDGLPVPAGTTYFFVSLRVEAGRGGFLAAWSGKVSAEIRATVERLVVD